MKSLTRRSSKYLEWPTILSNDKRNDQGRTWCLSHKEKNVGKIHVVRPSVVKEKFHLESCVSLLKGYKRCNQSLAIKVMFLSKHILPSAIPTMVKPSISYQSFSKERCFSESD